MINMTTTMIPKSVPAKHVKMKNEVNAPDFVIGTASDRTIAAAARKLSDRDDNSLRPYMERENTFVKGGEWGLFVDRIALGAKEQLVASKLEAELQAEGSTSVNDAHRWLSNVTDFEDYAHFWFIGNVIESISAATENAVVHSFVFPTKGEVVINPKIERTDTNIAIFLGDKVEHKFGSISQVFQDFAGIKLNLSNTVYERHIEQHSTLKPRSDESYLLVNDAELGNKIYSTENVLKALTRSKNQKPSGMLKEALRSTAPIAEHTLNIQELKEESRAYELLFD